MLVEIASPGVVPPITASFLFEVAAHLFDQKGLQQRTIVCIKLQKTAERAKIILAEPLGDINTLNLREPKIIRKFKIPIVKNSPVATERRSAGTQNAE